jgi:phosphatidylglycerophosphate synthase
MATWAIVARDRGLHPNAGAYWDAAADWLLVRLERM